MHSNKTTLVIALAMALTAAPVFAQDEATETGEGESAQTLEKISVTGTRIKGVDLEGAVPIEIISQEEIRASGATSVIELLEDYPQFGGGTGTFSTTSSGAKQADSPAGAAGISLRGLGTASTLTLINGRRVQVSSFANGSESFVDVNAIPWTAIERIEVLTSGASAIYGADAVAGVVNVILREDFSGLQVQAGYEDSTRDTDEARTSASVLWGEGFENGNAMLVVDYYKRNALYDRDRDFTAEEPRPSQQGIWPSFNLDPDLIESDITEATCPDDQFGVGRFGEYCGLNRNAFTANIPETERLGVVGTFNYELDNGTRWFNELTYSENRSKANSEPAPWSGEYIDLDHPGIPSALQSRFDDIAETLAEFDLDPVLRGWGRFPDPRTIRVESENVRLVSGLEGYWGQWSWEGAVNAGYNRNRQEAVAGIYNVAKFRAALFGELCPDGTTNCSPEGDGLYYNPFEGQSRNDDALLDLLREEVPRDGRSKLFGADFQISGELFSMPAGPAMSAFGFEARHESIEDDPSPLAEADPENDFEVPVYGFGSTSADADRDQYALYGELYLPLLDTLDAQVAGRLDHYSDFGSDFNPKVALRWQPVEQFVGRASWGTSFRAPSLAQTGAGVTLSSGALPCSEESEFFDNFCDQFSEDDFYLSDIYGNPDLEAEEADSWNLGFGWDITPDTNLTMDYWRYEHENLVDIDAEELFRRALDNPDLVFAEGELPFGQIGIETRDGTIGSPIEYVQHELINVGRQETDGFDLSLSQYVDLEDSGLLLLYLDTTYVNSFERKESPSTPVEKLAGEWTYPELLARAGARWEVGNWSTSLVARYTDSYNEDFEREGVELGDKVSSWTVWDLSVIYDYGPDSWIKFWVDNAFDEDPPRAKSAYNLYDRFNHNALGRMAGIRFVKTFR